MSLACPVPPRHWPARLALVFERRGARTVLVSRRHDGPLLIQKPLYPEGDAVCHAIVVHPPAGIADGDELEINARVGRDCRVLATTPGAGKWYRSLGPWARQKIECAVESGASLEWLPQETIVFTGARAELSLDVKLAGDAGFIGWEILCLGRTGSGERFAAGAYRGRTRVERDGMPIWFESAALAGSGRELLSPAILDGCPVAGTLVAASPALNERLLAACREIAPVRGEAGVTLLPGILVSRYLGDRSEAAKRYFIRLWRVLRPAVVGRAAIEPRLWRT